MRLWVNCLFGPDSNFVFDVYYVFFTHILSSDCRLVAMARFRECCVRLALEWKCFIENDHKTDPHVSQSLIQLKATSFHGWSDDPKIWGNSISLKTGSHWPFLCFGLKVLYVNRWLCQCSAVWLGSNLEIRGDCSKPQSGWQKTRNWMDMIQIWWYDASTAYKLWDWNWMWLFEHAADSLKTPCLPDSALENALVLLIQMSL